MDCCLEILPQQPVKQKKTHQLEKQPPAQNLAESASLLMEKTAILQPIGSSDKGKQPTLAPGKHSNMWTPILLNITSNTPLINQIMAYRDIVKLEKFSSEEDNAYSWIVDAEKAITTNGWNDDHTIQALPFFLTKTADLWYQSLAEKPTSFTEFKLTFLQYFCDLNTLIRLQNQFSIIKQKDHEASAEQEANHTQTVNLAINGTSDIDAKITQLSEKLTQKIEGFLAGTTETYQSSQQRENNNNNRYPQQQNQDQDFDKSTSVEEKNIEQISQPSKQTKSNIPPAIITKDTTLAAIFSFDIDNLNTHSLFSGAAINQDKPIMALYTDARVRRIDIKLILDSGLATDGNTKTPIGEIDNFLFEINGIQILTKILVIEATQYQALVGNDWLSKANATFDWNTQELQLMFNGQHAQVLTMCGHFKTQCTKEFLIEFKDTLMPPTIETYQVS
ncbi:hypothetical protein G9A89_019705 [Geosiphon pyriformis]|nr:hypothetical protein G9A89_019705 [Geosiphon pyriformis]